MANAFDASMDHSLCEIASRRRVVVVRPWVYPNETP